MALQFEPKISGTRVTGYEIKTEDIVFDSQFITLAECIDVIHRQEAMNWLLDTLRFTKGASYKEGVIEWYATIDWDSIYKLTILEHYPEYEKEMIEYFGVHWMTQYIRFNH